MKKVENYPSVLNFKTETVLRPNANVGLWCMFLVPCCVLVSSVKNYKSLTENYKFWSIFSFGLLTTSLVLRNSLIKGKRLGPFNLWFLFSFIINGILFHVCLGTGFLFSLICGASCTFIYNDLYFRVLKNFPRCFTFGEAAIITQGILLYLLSLTINVYKASLVTPKTYMQISSLIVQVGLFGIGLLFLISYSCRIQKAAAFYLIAFMVFTFCIILPLHVFLSQSPILWILSLIFSDVTLLKVVLSWSICCALAGFAISRQIWNAKKASTSVRKTFHILAFMVYLPGLFQACTFLYLATGVVLGIFIVLELLRIQNIPPLGHHLQDGYAVFSDEKDAGVLALTPIYLLIGCSLPLWIHPSPCDITDSTVFTVLPLLSGLLSIGIGDTAASVVGSKFGFHKWTGNHRSIEGTFAYILSQLIVIFLLVHFGYLEHVKIEHYLRFVVAVIVTSLIEAKTTQVDNLILPLIMFIMVI